MTEHECPQSAFGDYRTEGMDTRATVGSHGREIPQRWPVLIEQSPPLARQRRSCVLELGPSRQSKLPSLSRSPYGVQRSQRSEILELRPLPAPAPAAAALLEQRIGFRTPGEAMGEIRWRYGLPH
jgi:hypothetical protein